MATIEALRDWLHAQINQCEHDIEEAGPFCDLQAEKEAYEAVLSKIDEIKMDR